MLKYWIDEARPKTLLLGITNCALGCALGFYYGSVSLYTLTAAFFIVLTGCLLQILSNFANDYGDAYRQADGPDRKGDIRAVMSGAISISQLKKGMAVVIVLSALSGVVAVGLAVGGNLQVLSWFIFLGVLSILAALFYTLGMAYGYKGLGDFFVFIFFGLVAVIGSQVLTTAAGNAGLDIYPDTVLLAISAGASSMMVLHVNGMRDISEDLKHGKRTLAARLGYTLSCVYLAGLFAVTACTSMAACFFSHKAWEMALLALALMPLLAATVRTIRNARNAERIAPELKYTSIGSAAHALCWLLVLTLDYWIYA
ncbi:MAG: 1,4-dihydroxy-2-naphthoate octaprenyltransferase [Succinivibrio sp.]|jgi:1,4-dihydroxy-2-naphthoate octaprenyltransferase|nr:1,4-dihydroxy-2-naphthoate octaprenyltransferase [Succinivibrio sp.]